MFEIMILRIITVKADFISLYKSDKSVTQGILKASLILLQAIISLQ